MNIWIEEIVYSSEKGYLKAILIELFDFIKLSSEW